MVLKMPSVFQTMSGAGSSNVNSNSMSWRHRDTDLGNEANGEYNLRLGAHAMTMPFAEYLLQDTSGARLGTTRAAESTHATNDADAADNANTTDNADAPDNADTADTIDADLLEILVNNRHTATNTEQDHPVEAQLAEPLVPPPIELRPPALTQPDADRSDTPSVVDHFPQGSPGVPIPEAPQGSSVYQSGQEAFGASVWAPFRTQSDWEIARWAKMHGPTSLAMEELLAIPEVCTPRLAIIVMLTHCQRLLISSGCHTAQQKSSTTLSTKFCLGTRLSSVALLLLEEKVWSYISGTC
jgi:hypothetical protein